MKNFAKLFLPICIVPRKSFFYIKKSKIKVDTVPLKWGRDSGIQLLGNNSRTEAAGRQETRYRGEREKSKEGNWEKERVKR